MAPGAPSSAEQLGRLGLVDWSKVSVDSASVPAKRVEKTAPNPVDRDRPDSKCYLLVDRGSTPLAVRLTGAAVHDLKVFEALIEGLA